MGLSKFWSTITGPKVKEITPQEKCKWLEQPRPVTSSGQRFTKSNISLPLDAEAAASKRSTTTSDDKSSIFKSRRGWRRRKSLSGIRPSPAKDAPQVPDLVPEPEPVPFAAPETQETNEREDELERPGTALTIDEIDLAASNHVFELPATTVVPPKTEHESELASRPATRKRSKSSASDKPRQKRASWYSIGRWRDDDAQPPPPLPTSELEPPVAKNAEAPSIIELPVYDANAPILPASQSFRDSLGAESILRAFPSVPSLKNEDPIRTPTTPTLRDSAVVTSPNPRKPTLGIPDVHKPLPSPKSFSQPLSPVLGPESFPRPPSNPASIDGKLKPRRSSMKSQKSSHHSSRSDDGFLSQEQQREYNRVTRFLEGMDHSKRTSGVVGVVTEVDDHYFPAPPPPPPLLHPAEQKFSNDAALAALEFGIGGEKV